MAESTKLCPMCKEIMKPCCYAVGKQDGTERLENKIFSYDGVGLEFEEDAIEAIAKMAVERKTGARGLRSIMENVMMDVMYEIPSDDTIRECKITKAAVDGTGEPVVVRY